jgi:hypothetical protein
VALFQNFAQAFPDANPLLFKGLKIGTFPYFGADSATKNNLFQVGFFDIVALPLFQSFAQAFPDASPMLDAVKDNYAMWKEEVVLSQSQGK